MEIARSKKRIVISRRKCILNLLKEIGMSGYRPTNIPIDPSKKPRDDKEGDLVDTSRNQRLVVKLIYLSHTQLDISFFMRMEVSSCTRLMRKTLRRYIES